MAKITVVPSELITLNAYRGQVIESYELTAHEAYYKAFSKLGEIGSNADIIISGCFKTGFTVAECVTLLMHERLFAMIQLALRGGDDDGDT